MPDKNNSEHRMPDVIWADTDGWTDDGGTIGSTEYIRADVIIKPLVWNRLFASALMSGRYYIKLPNFEPDFTLFVSGDFVVKKHTLDEAIEAANDLNRIYVQSLLEGTAQ